MAETYVTLSSLKHYDEKIKGVIDEKQDKLVGTAGQVVSFDENGNVVSKDLETVDTSVIEDSTNAVSGGAVYEALSEKAEIVEITQEGYNNLSDEEKDADIAYFIIDANSGSNGADASINKGDLLVPYQNINSTDMVTYTDSSHTWSEYKGFVLGVQATGGDNSEWSEVRYIPANYATLSKAFRHCISISQITFAVDAYAQINVADNTLTAFNSNLVSFTNPRVFLYGIK